MDGGAPRAGDSGVPARHRPRLTHPRVSRDPRVWCGYVPRETFGWRQTLGWGSAAVGAQPVAGAAHGLDRVAVEGPVDLVADVPHVDVDDVGRAVVGEVPDVVDDRRAAEHPALVAQQQFEE